MTTPTDEYVDITLNGTQVLLIGLVLCGMFFGTGYVVGYNQSSKGNTPAVAQVQSDSKPLSTPATSDQQAPQASPAATTQRPETAIEPAATAPSAAPEPSPTASQPKPEPVSSKAARERTPAAAQKPRAVAANRAPSQPRPARSEPKPAPAPAAAPASSSGAAAGGSLIHLEVSAARAGDNPQQLVSELRLKGFPAVLKAPDTGEPARILVGPFRETGAAMKQWTQLRQNGFDAWLVRQ